jgi:hypothetical protein
VVVGAADAEDENREKPLDHDTEGV